MDLPNQLGGKKIVHYIFFKEFVHYMLSLSLNIRLLSNKEKYNSSLQNSSILKKMVILVNKRLKCKFCPLILT